MRRLFYTVIALMAFLAFPALSHAQDADSDGFEYFEDCDDYDPNVWVSCGYCWDYDGDTWYSGCDQYATVNGPDCNDANPGVFPGRPEIVGDGIDQDCNGVDLCYLDNDNDNFGTSTTIIGFTLNCSTDNNRAPVSTDCNDASAAINPIATETVADSVDQNCDGKDMCYTDADNDNYGTGVTINGLTLNCSTDANRAPVSTDCNDASATVYPAAAETVGDGIDQNCDGVDLCYTDADNDNYGTGVTINGLTLNCSTDANRSPVSTDCNDASATVYPGRSETVADGIDQDCDGVDLCYTDNDNDNFGTGVTINGLTLNCSTDANRAPVSTDCNDNSNTVYPGRSETVADGIDQDCDAKDMCYQDNDNDNYGTGVTINGLTLNCSTDANRAPVSTDCNDNSNTVYPGRSEAVADGIDQDCDGKDMCYTDADNDNYGTVVMIIGLTLSCSTDVGRAPNSIDCNDANPTVYPGRVETVGDGIDQDCDARDMCYQDNDNDNYGVFTTNNGLTLSCSADANRAPVPTDCNDANPAVYPTATEAVADGIDQNCDTVDLCYLDNDNDNYGVSTTTNGFSLNCWADANRAPVSTDCNDANPTIHPGATEVLCDGVDNDCVAFTEDDKDTDNDLATFCAGDCNDNNPNVWVSCATCLDADSDAWYVGCDAYATVSGPDCNDAAISIYQNAPELCDGIDNQCSGDPGHGTIDEGCVLDPDGDGLTDAEEGALGTDRLDPDTDDDGLNDGAEVTAGTSPLIADSDGDGWLDGIEVQRGTDPLSAASYPGPTGPTELVNYQGRMMNAGGLPSNGPVTMAFAIYGVAVGGAPIWTESQVVTVNQGIYNVLLGSVSPLDPEMFVGSTSDGFYLQVTADGETLSPRQRLAFVPFAMASNRLFDGRLEMDGRTLTINAAAAVKTVHVNFNQAFFAPPRVVVSPLDDEIGGVPFMAAKLRNITTTGFDVTFRSLTGATAAGSAAFTYQAFGN